MEYKLKDTTSKEAFNYGYLLKRIFPYMKPVMGRAVINLIIAIPLGLLDGVVALSLKPYLYFSQLLFHSVLLHLHCFREF